MDYGDRIISPLWCPVSNGGLEAPVLLFPFLPCTFFLTYNLTLNYNASYELL